jgi:hypothetical protein
MSNAKKWCGCFAIGCFTLVVIGAIGGYWLYHRTLKWGREAAATGVEAVVGEFAKAHLTPDEQNEFMAPVQQFAQRIRDGKVDLKQATEVGKELMNGPIIPALLAQAFVTGYIRTPEMPEEQRLSGERTVSRFVHGMFEGKIKPEEFEEINEILQEEVQEGRRTRKTLKKKLTPEELNECLARMKKAADDAGVPDADFKVDLPREVAKIIQVGLKDPPPPPGLLTLPTAPGQ